MFYPTPTRPFVTKFQPHQRYMHHTYMHTSGSSVIIMDTTRITDTTRIMDTCIMYTSAWVPWPERPKGGKDKVKQVSGPRLLVVNYMYGMHVEHEHTQCRSTEHAWCQSTADSTCRLRNVMKTSPHCTFNVALCMYNVYYT